MTQVSISRRNRLRTPRAAALAGIIFSLLLITSLVLLYLSLPERPLQTGDWQIRNGRLVGFALNLVPFAGIAFLWFIGVIRDRLGDAEDRFFSTVFFGSGLLFLAMLFAGSAAIGGLLLIFATTSEKANLSDTYVYARALTYQIFNIYGIKMAGVFMISTSTLGIRTGIMPRWMALLGYALALILLLSIGLISWIAMVFPCWVLLISSHFLIDSLTHKPTTDTAAPGESNA